MISLSLALMLAAAAPAEAPAATDPAGSTQPAKPVKPKKICKKIQMTGSNLGKRICKTEEQWNGQAANGSQTLELLDQSYKASAGNGS